jgi:hypothetical protein
LKRAVWLGLALALVGCTKQPATEVMVLVHSDLAPSQLQSMLIRVEVNGQVQSATPCTPVAGPDALPVSVGLVPQGHSSGPFTVRAVGYSDAACAQFSAEQSATLQFLADHVLELDLNLLAVCAGRMCAPGTTCDESGGCHSDSRDSLPDYSPNATNDLGAGADLSTTDLSQTDLSSTDSGGVVASTCTSFTSPGKLCDGFEAPSLNGIWSMDQTNSTFTLDGSRAYRGSQSVHIATQAVSASTDIYAHLVETYYVGGGTNHVFVRAFFYLSSPRTMNTMTLSTINSVTSGINIDIGAKAAGNFHMNSAGATPQSQTAIQLLPLDTWFCFEYEVDASATPAVVNAWLNDNTQVLMQGGISMDPLHSVGLGLSIYGPSVAEGAHDLWVDEVIVDSQRIGCAK